MFFVYIYLDPRFKGDFTYQDLLLSHKPIYVGKGTLNRHKDHWNVICNNKTLDNVEFSNKLRKLKKLNLEPIILKLFEFNLESDAYNKEKELISIIGRKRFNKGPLLNVTEGGESNAIQMIEVRRRDKMEINQKISNAKKGVALSEEHKDRLSEAAKKKFASGYKQYTKGKTLEECYSFEKALEIKEKLKKSRKNLFDSGYENPNKGKSLEDTLGKERADKLKKEASDRMTGKTPINKGKKLEELVGAERSEILKKEQSNRRKNKKHSEEIKKQISASCLKAHELPLEQSEFIFVLINKGLNFSKAAIEFKDQFNKVLTRYTFNKKRKILES